MSEQKDIIGNQGDSNETGLDNNPKCPNRKTSGTKETRMKQDNTITQQNQGNINVGDDV